MEIICSVGNFLSRFKKDCSGLSAVEFALIVPIMVTTFFGIGETSLWMQAHHRMTRVSSTVADLVAQDTAVDDTKMDDILACADAVLQPFDSANAWVRVTSVVADAAGQTTVDWSDAQNTSARATGSTITVPDGIVSAGASVLLAEAGYTYTSTFGMFLTGGITATDKFYIKPRRSIRVTRL
jgi:Flp pilus assembly protein TadG